MTLASCLANTIGHQGNPARESSRFRANATSLLVWKGEERQLSYERAILTLSPLTGIISFYSENMRWNQTPPWCCRLSATPANSPTSTAFLQGHLCAKQDERIYLRYIGVKIQPPELKAFDDTLALGFVSGLQTNKGMNLCASISSLCKVLVKSVPTLFSG